jgi:hypothetical protein
MCSPYSCVCKENYIRVSRANQTCVPKDECEGGIGFCRAVLLSATARFLLLQLKAMQSVVKTKNTRVVLARAKHRAKTASDSLVYSPNALLDVCAKKAFLEQQVILPLHVSNVTIDERSFFYLESSLLTNKLNYC